MYYTDESLIPENQDPLIITAAPYGAIWMPSDFPEDIPVTWDQQVQKAVDCYNAGATIMHIHVRNPKTVHISKNLKEYGDLIGRLRAAVPKMVLQVGGSISFAPEGDKAAKWQRYDTRHMLAEIDPKPDQVTLALGSTTYDMTPLCTPDDFVGTSMENNSKSFWQYAQMVADATPEFYIEHIKRLVKKGIQPYFSLAYIHSLMIMKRVRLIAITILMAAALTATGCLKLLSIRCRWLRRRWSASHQLLPPRGMGLLDCLCREEEAAQRFLRRRGWRRWGGWSDRNSGLCSNKLPMFPVFRAADWLRRTTQ
jgi:hypothetical protein